MRVLIVLLSVLALAVAAAAGVAPERAAVKPAAGDPIAVRPADPMPMDMPANTLSGTVSRSAVAPMTLPVDGTWFAMNCDMTTIGPDGQGGWQDEPSTAWEVTSPWRIVLLIADYLVVGDKYQVWVDGAPAGRTGPRLDDGSFYGCAGLESDWSLLMQSEGCEYFNEPGLSSGVVVIPAGTHTIEIKCTHFASGYTGSSCIIKAEERWAKCPTFNGAPTMAKIGADDEEETSWGAVKTLFR